MKNYKEKELEEIILPTLFLSYKFDYDFGFVNACIDGIIITVHYVYYFCQALKQEI